MDLRLALRVSGKVCINRRHQSCQAWAGGRVGDKCPRDIRIISGGPNAILQSNRLDGVIGGTVYVAHVIAHSNRIWRCAAGSIKPNVEVREVSRAGALQRDYRVCDGKLRNPAGSQNIGVWLVNINIQDCRNSVGDNCLRVNSGAGGGVIAPVTVDSGNAAPIIGDSKKSGVRPVLGQPRARAKSEISVVSPNSWDKFPQVESEHGKGSKQGK